MSRLPMIALGIAATVLDRCRRPADVTDLRLRMIRLESELMDLRARVGEVYLHPEEMKRR